MALGLSVVQQARTWIGTPWHHQGRVKGPNGGVDCIGLVVGVASELNIKLQDVENYPRKANGLLESELEKQFIHIPDKTLTVGSVLLFDLLHEWRHVGIWTDNNTLIHVHHTTGFCLEHIYDIRWKRRLTGVYTWRK